MVIAARMSRCPAVAGAARGSTCEGDVHRICRLCVKRPDLGRGEIVVEDGALGAHALRVRLPQPHLVGHHLRMSSRHISAPAFALAGPAAVP